MHLADFAILIHHVYLVIDLLLVGLGHSKLGHQLLPFGLHLARKLLFQHLLQLLVFECNMVDDGVGFERHDW